MSRSGRYAQRVCWGHPRASSAGCVYEHILVAEAALGRYLPLGVEVHHVNGNTHDNRPANFVICQDAAHHKLLHVRERVLRAGGDPNTQRICATCGQLKLFAEFNVRRTNVNAGLQGHCRECSKAAFKAWWQTNGRRKRPAA